jgi:hypothetical protein
MRGVSFCSALSLVVVLPLWAATPKSYQRGEIVRVEQKARTRTLYYLVNTPVTKDEPYYQLAVKVNQTIYVGEYTPRHSADTLPVSWSQGAEVQVKVEKRHFFVKSPSEDEIDFAVVKRVPAASWQPSDAGKSEN